MNIIERLNGDEYTDAIDDAINEIELLRRRIAELEQQAEQDTATMLALAQTVEVKSEHVAELEAEVEQLRFAIQQALMAWEDGYYAPKITDDLREALGRKEGEETMTDKLDQSLPRIPTGTRDMLLVDPRRVTELEAEVKRLREALKDQIRRKREGLVATTERIRGLKTEVERLREALKAVEWVDGQDAAAGMGGEMEQVCPWCSKVGTTDDGWAHEPDCIRQAAIAKARGRE